MYTLDFNPVLLKLGALEIRWYGIIYLIAFTLVYFYFKHWSKRLKMDKEALTDFMFYLILGIIVGGRLFYFLFYNITALKNPLEFFAVWHGGMAFHGGLIGAIFGMMYAAKKHKIKIWEMLDLGAVIGALCLAIGRVGNILNAELAGTPFDGAWCVIFPVDSICRHPYPVYALISHVILFVYLGAMLYKTKDKIGSKLLSANFLIGYGVLRIITDVWKHDYLFLNIKTGQWLSIAMIIAGFWLLKKRSRSSDN